MMMTAFNLYQAITRYGDLYELNINGNIDNLLHDLKQFDNDWKAYNPRKNIRREGLSITSLDGGLSGIPDLDSVYEYNKTHNVKLTEKSFNTPTPVYPYVSQWLDLFKEDLGRTHLIRLQPGGFFPIHRDNRSINIETFRLFVPILNCNYPNMTFILNRRLLNFNQGSVYFMDTCLEHMVFNSGIDMTCIFIVANVALNERSVSNVLKSMAAN